MEKAVAQGCTGSEYRGFRATEALCGKKALTSPNWSDILSDAWNPYL